MGSESNHCQGNTTGIHFFYPHTDSVYIQYVISTNALFYPTKPTSQQQACLRFTDPHRIIICSIMITTYHHHHHHHHHPNRHRHPHRHHYHDHHIHQEALKKKRFKKVRKCLSLEPHMRPRTDANGLKLSRNHCITFRSNHPNLRVPRRPLRLLGQSP